MPDRRTIAALCVVEDALHHCQYTGLVQPPAWALRLALACLYDEAGDDPGVRPRTREPFDRLWRLVTGAEKMGSAIGCQRSRSTFAWTEYAAIRRMVRVPQTIENDSMMVELRKGKLERR